MKNLKVIAFDADDTLWLNEPNYQEAEHKFCGLLEEYLPAHTVSKELFKVEMQNLEIYGYGVKAFVLSMIETAIKITDHQLPAQVIERIIGYGKELLSKPIELLDGIIPLLEELKPEYKLVVATKGDLLDQERKLRNSGLESYFHHIEIMSDKKEADYKKLLRHLDIDPTEFLMIGNSLKSDVIPVINIGGWGIHVPYHTTWAHEVVEGNYEHERFQRVDIISNIKEILR